MSSNRMVCDICVDRTWSKPASRNSDFERLAVAKAEALIRDWTQMALGDLAQVLEERDLVVRKPGRNRQPAVLRERPAHLSRGRRLVGEELKPLLAEDDLKLLAIFKRQVTGIAFAPVNVRRDRAGHGQHARADIHADQAPAMADPFTRYASDDAGAAGDVEDALGGTRIYLVDREFGPGTKQRANELPLVILREAGLVHCIALAESYLSPSKAGRHPLPL